MSKNEQIAYKYKIKEMLERLPVCEHDKIVPRIHELIGRSHNTTNNYIGIPLGSKKDIPYGAMLVFEEILNVPARELCNFPIPKISYEDLLKRPLKKRLTEKTGC